MTEEPKPDTVTVTLRREDAEILLEEIPEEFDGLESARIEVARSHIRAALREALS